MSIAGLLRQESAAWKAEAERAAGEIQALRLENEALRKRLENATEFVIYRSPLHWGYDRTKWHITKTNEGLIFNKNGEWELRQSPRNCDGEWAARCLFDTFEEAEAAARKAMEVHG